MTEMEMDFVVRILNCVVPAVVIVLGAIVAVFIVYFCTKADKIDDELCALKRVIYKMEDDKKVDRKYICEMEDIYLSLFRLIKKK